LIELELNQQSVNDVLEEVDQVRQRILEQIREGMLEAMERLAWVVVGHLGGDPIVSRSGQLFGAIVGSPKVTETSDVIRGTVTSDVGLKHIGLWLEEGTHVPAVEAKLFEFSEPGAAELFSHGHRAFEVEAHPFMNPSLRDDQAAIMQILADHIAEAIA
jgi:hypothetical protein